MLENLLATVITQTVEAMVQRAFAGIPHATERTRIQAALEQPEYGIGQVTGNKLVVSVPNTLADTTRNALARIVNN